MVQITEITIHPRDTVHMNSEGGRGGAVVALNPLAIIYSIVFC
jgi:hypothetical protein